MQQASGHLGEIPTADIFTVLFLIFLRPDNPMERDRLNFPSDIFGALCKFG